ncbi:Arm DNA-binding domain-containing protein [Enterovibrio gelatinilyticus]|uniref:Arm DNA-binding domain-containing protein n=1 Tax=Enterovibrio gelatinilyticus TaxID=2899819 RepID=UPI0023646E00|nr:DUF3596 domain-containing protein [Enterovibrio sp. ZSDZ42]
MSLDISTSNIKKAGRLRAVIVSEISVGEFDYLERFPNSKAAAKLNTKQSGGKQFTTISDLVARWLVVKEAEVSERTLRNLSSQCRTVENAMAGDRMVTSVTAEDVLILRNNLVDGKDGYFEQRGKSRKASTVNRYLDIFSEIWDFGVQSKYAADNPFISAPRLNQDKEGPDPLEMDEFERLINHPSMDEQDKNLWTLACFTGLRHGELCALAWEDIDLLKGELKVCRNLADDIFKVPKTKSGERIINLLEPAIDALKRQREITYLMQPNAVSVQTRERDEKNARNRLDGYSLQSEH